MTIKVDNIKIRGYEVKTSQKTDKPFIVVRFEDEAGKSYEIIDQKMENAVCYKQDRQGYFLADLEAYQDYTKFEVIRFVEKTTGGSNANGHLIKGTQQKPSPFHPEKKVKVKTSRLEKVLTKVQTDHAGTQLIFLTLTVKNVSGDKLREALDQLTVAWRRLTRRRPVARAVKGSFRALEVTRNRAKDTYHPHIHAILVVENDYFLRSKGLYFTHDRWVEMWQEALRVDYAPSVDVRSTYQRQGDKAVKTAANAVFEAAKYATKDCEYVNKKMLLFETTKKAGNPTVILHRKRTTAMAGWIAEAAKELGFL